MRCDICGGVAELDYVCSQPDRAMRSQRIEYWTCTACGVARRLPPPDADELRAYYEKAWQFSEPRPSRCFRAAADFIFNCIGSFIGKWPALDIGAKDSALLHHLPVVPCAMDAKPTSEGVIKAWFGDGYESKEKYRLVTATHVLEHAIDPHAFMRDVVGCMEPLGWLYIEVPTLEQGTKDISACDDLNPNHLWHFTLRSLLTLMEASGLMVVRAQSDSHAYGWPCNRIMAQRQIADGVLEVAAAEDLLYETAVDKIERAGLHATGLYGASFSCWKLIRMNVELPVYDLYKTGTISGQEIRHPSRMREDGTKRVWLTPRFWNSQREISRYLQLHHPEIEVLCPYE